MSSTDKPGVLKITFANDNASAEFNPTNGAANDVDLHVAMLGFDLNAKPSAGENNGRNLRQDFVVLSVVNEKMSSAKAEIHLATDSRARRSRRVDHGAQSTRADPGSRWMASLKINDRLLPSQYRRCRESP